MDEIKELAKQMLLKLADVDAESAIEAGDFLEDLFERIEESNG